MTSTVSVEISGPIATITFNRPHSLNAFRAEGNLLYRYILMSYPYRVFPDYGAFADALRRIDKNPTVAVTIWQGGSDSPPLLASHFNSMPTATGKWFCTGADVKARSDSSNASTERTVRSEFVPWVASTHLDTSKAVCRVVHLQTASSLLV